MDLREAQRLAERLMKENGLISPKWIFKFDNAKRRFGVCKYTYINRATKDVKCGHISLSKYLVSANDEKQVRDTILHEIAHALTPGHGHDYVWKQKCIEIGAKPERCYSSKDVNTETVKATARYQATCGGCGIVHVKHRMTSTMWNQKKWACKCQSSKSWDKKILLKYIDTKAV